MATEAIDSPLRANGARAGRAGRHAAAVDLMDEVGEEIRGTKTAPGARAAGGRESADAAIRRAGEELQLEHVGLALHVEPAARRARQIVGRIRRTDGRDIAAAVATFGRRHPAVFIGGAFVLGLGLARFVKSSSVRTGDVRPAQTESRVGLGWWTPPDGEPSTSLEDELARTGGGF